MLLFVMLERTFLNCCVKREMKNSYEKVEFYYKLFCCTFITVTSKEDIFKERTAHGL